MEAAKCGELAAPTREFAVIEPPSHVGAAALFAVTHDAPPAVNAYPLPAVPVPFELDAAAFAALPVSSDALARRRKVHALEAALLSNVPGSDKGPEPLHLVSDGMYFRQLTIPAGLVVVSKRHAREHFCTISRGSATVFTEDGITKVVGPYAFVSPAGSKRVLLVHEEIVWATVHRTTFNNIDEIERDIAMDETILLGEAK